MTVAHLVSISCCLTLGLTCTCTTCMGGQIINLDFLSLSSLHTQEDTKRLIQSLRARAKETKDFLQLANSRLIDLS